MLAYPETETHRDFMLKCIKNGQSIDIGTPIPCGAHQTDELKDVYRSSYTHLSGE